MPRKSLPATRSTPLRPPAKRGQSSTPAGRSGRTGSTRKRARPLPEDDDLESLTADPAEQATTNGNAVNAAHIDVVANSTDGMDPEKELEQWQDFAVDHYEMVEQLPLELHRNYRLLRELDDGVILHSAKLQSTIREYIALRLNTKAKPTSPVIPPEEVPPLPSLALDGTKEDNGNDNVPDTPGGDLPTPIPDGAGGQVVPPFAEQVNETTTSDDQTEDAPGANGNGPIETNGTGGKDAEADADGEIVEVEQVVEARKAFPSVSPDRARADFLPPQAIHHETPEPEGSVGGNQAWNLLPEIARLAREMVKNGEEKVAVAQGAYNSVDRHIRALDSALSAQEASILLGLRPNTEPSALVGEDLDGLGFSGAGDEEGDLAIGIGGGGRKRKGRASRAGKRKTAAGEKTGPSAGGGGLDQPPQPVFHDADPTEPRYCYCNQVSYGEMIGCDNDDCPIEWFHLSCAGLTTPPTGKWLCDRCKPDGLGKGGAGATAPRGGPARNRGRASKGGRRR